MSVKLILLAIMILILQSCMIQKNQFVGRYEMNHSEQSVITSKIILRRNYTFKKVEHFFEAEKKTVSTGTWSIKNDTIELEFTNSNIWNQKYAIQVNKSRIMLCQINRQICYRKNKFSFKRQKW